MYITKLDAAPSAAVAGRLRDRRSLIWIDSEASASPLARHSFLGVEPRHFVQVKRNAVLFDGRRIDKPVVDVMRTLASGDREQVDAPPFRGGWMGYITYEFAERLLPWTPPRLVGDETLAEFGFYDAVLAWDHDDDTCRLVATTEDAASSPAARALLDAHAEALRTGSASNPTAGGAPSLAWTADQPPEAFTDAVRMTQAYIAQGDIYQANIARTFSARLPENVSTFDHYLSVRRANSAPFSAFLDFPARTIASTSPERFLSVAGSRVEARPIKGTARTSADPLEDAELRHRLETSEKDRAENIMIVDLLRNDLSKVCRPHSVETPQVCAVESYEGLHHLVSCVTGTLKPGHDAYDVIAAAFPGGSITGAPKLRAMEIIAELETGPRGIFCGSIGYVGVDGTMDFNIAIRTIEYDGQDARLHVGAGITALSDADAELEETRLKAEPIVGRIVG